MDFLTKIIFHFKEIKVVLITGKGRNYTSEAIWQVLSPHFKVKKIIEKIPNIFDVLTNKVFIIETDLKNKKIFKKIVNLTKFSQLPILVVTHVGEIPINSDFFAGDKKETVEIRELAQLIPPYGFLILNFDDKTVGEIDDITNIEIPGLRARSPEAPAQFCERRLNIFRKIAGFMFFPSVRLRARYGAGSFLPEKIKNFSFGFQEGADFRASDVHTNTGTNFKINYKGKIIPIWQEKLIGKEYIYSALATSCVGIVLGLNFVEISEALRGLGLKPEPALEAKK